MPTLDELFAGLRPPYLTFKHFSGNVGHADTLWSGVYRPGIPGAAVAPSPGLSGEALTNWTYSPAIEDGSGSNVVRLVGVTVTNLGNGVAVQPVMLADRLWQNSGINVTTTTAQSFGTPVALPARDADGTTAGRGVYIAIEVSSATTTANTTMTLSYTNSAGTSGRTATMSTEGAAGLPNGASAGTWALPCLQAGDVGVRSVESITLSSSLTAGTIHVVLFRPIWVSPGVFTTNRGIQEDILDVGCPKLYDGTSLQAVGSGTLNKSYEFLLTVSETSS